MTLLFVYAAGLVTGIFGTILYAVLTSGSRADDWLGEQ